MISVRERPPTLLQLLLEAWPGVSRDAVLVVSPDHARLFREADWSRPQLIAALTDHLGRDASTVLVVHAGGGAGLFSALLPGWVGGAEGSQPVTRPIDA